MNQISLETCPVDGRPCRKNCRPEIAVKENTSNGLPLGATRIAVVYCQSFQANIPLDQNSASLLFSNNQQIKR